jgi:hypothetical protein
MNKLLEKLRLELAWILVRLAIKLCPTWDAPVAFARALKSECESRRKPVEVESSADYW